MKMLLGSFCVASVYGAQESKEDFELPYPKEPLHTWPHTIALPCCAESRGLWDNDPQRRNNELHLDGRAMPGHPHPQGVFRVMERGDLMAICDNGNAMSTRAVLDAKFAQNQGKGIQELIGKFCAFETIDGMEALSTPERFNGRKKVVVEGYNTVDGKVDLRFVDAQAAIDESKVYVHWIDRKSAWVLYPKCRQIRESYHDRVPIKPALGYPRYNTIRSMYQTGTLPWDFEDYDHYHMNYTLGKLTINHEEAVAKVEEASWRPTIGNGRRIYQCDPRLYPGYMDKGWGWGNQSSTIENLHRNPDLALIQWAVPIRDYETPWLVSEIVRKARMNGVTNNALTDQIAEMVGLGEPRFMEKVTEEDMERLSKLGDIYAKGFSENIKSAVREFKMRQVAAEKLNDDLTGSMDQSEENDDFDPLYSNADAINIHLARLRSITDDGETNELPSLNLEGMDGGEMDELD